MNDHIPVKGYTAKEIAGHLGFNEIQVQMAIENGAEYFYEVKKYVLLNWRKDAENRYSYND